MCRTSRRGRRGARLHAWGPGLRDLRIAGTLRRWDQRNPSCWDTKNTGHSDRRLESRRAWLSETERSSHRDRHHPGHRYEHLSSLRDRYHPGHRDRHHPTHPHVIHCNPRCPQPRPQICSHPQPGPQICSHPQPRPQICSHLQPRPRICSQPQQPRSQICSHPQPHRHRYPY
jgi:hypothetical protein